MSDERVIETMTYGEWKVKYPDLKFILHNNSCEVHEAEWGISCEELTMTNSSNPDEIAGEIWFDTFYVPLGKLTIDDLLNLYADEKGIDVLNGKAVIRLWYD